MHNLMIPAGTVFRVRRLALHDKFWLGEGNFEGVPAVGKYGILEAGKYDHKVSDVEPTAYGVKIIAKRN